MGPPVAVWIAVAVAGVATAYLFKEYVYEPHLAPHIEVWAEEFLARRRAARNRAAAVPATSRRRSFSSSESSTEGDPSAHLRSHHPNNNNGSAATTGRGGRRITLDSVGAESYELEGLVAREVDEWRNEVRRSQNERGLRRRRGLGLGGRRSASDVEYDMLSTTMDESFATLTHTPLTPTHVISNISSPVSSDTLSLPPVPDSPAPTKTTARNRSSSQSTAMAQEVNAIFTIPSSPPQELPKSPDMETDTETDIAPPSSLISPHLITIPPIQSPSGRSSVPCSGPGSASTSTCQTPAAERDEDSPFGPLLPDTPRSSPGLYGARPFSPIVRVMGSASSSSSSGSEVVNGPASSRVSASRRLGSVGRRGSALVYELAREGVDVGEIGEDNGADTSGTLDTNGRTPVREETDAHSPVHGSNMDMDIDHSYTNSSIASLSQRYPAPPTPPVLVSPPPSDGVRSLPSSSSPASPTLSFSSPPVRPQGLSVSVSTLRVPTMSRSRSRERSAERSPALSSPTASFASFTSPLSAARTISMSEVSESDAEFLSAADTDNDSDEESDSESGSGSGVRVSPGSTGSSAAASSSGAPVLIPDTDRTYNPFLDFEEVFGEGSDGSSEGSWEIHESVGHH
ncbi:hypothetical protein V8B97DRAFT_1876821 [Scleroderma yunnanense]